MKKNRLAREKSPYLLQHAENPVDWHPWGDEAFRKAEEEDKPLFLSIGYSTCHWCHVMAHESFEDQEVARLLNDAFICIKVDREERPDIDKIYMTACQMLTGAGGWPLSIFMTPERQPFYAATYIPKESAYGRMGLLDLIPRIRQLWETQRSELLDAARELTDAVIKSADVSPVRGTLSGSLLDHAYKVLAASYDADFGGFGAPPKFPIPHQLLFLIRYGKQKGEKQAVAMASATLAAMARGGLYDHIGCGFHRYSTDRHWLVPHFEKMLYDQALLALACTEAYEATGDDAFKATAQEVFSYVLRDLTSPEGGFYSAEDADSEGVEGKFYVWTTAQIRDVLPQADADFIMDLYGAENGGNFRDEATQAKSGLNILHLREPLAETAARLQLTESALREKIAAARGKLFAVREKRVHPHKDDKILTDWNGLMIAALARGAQVLGEWSYLERANAAKAFIFKSLCDKEGRLQHRWREGETGGPANLDDYAFMIWGLLECYEAAFDPADLQWALVLQSQLDARFRDEANGGYFFTPDDGEQLLARQKEGYDGAIPSGNAVSMLNLIRLGRLTGNKAWENRAEQVGQAFAGMISRMPSGFTMFMNALTQIVYPGCEIVIAGDPAGNDTQEMLKEIRSLYLPNKVLLLRPPGAPSPNITELAPFTDGMVMLNGRATAYVCSGQTCQAPTNDLETLKKLLAPLT